jgi:hypothetical protein
VTGGSRCIRRPIIAGLLGRADIASMQPARNGPARNCRWERCPCSPMRSMPQRLPPRIRLGASAVPVSTTSRYFIPSLNWMLPYARLIWYV